MSLWRVDLIMDGEDLDEDGFIECLLDMRFKDWRHHVQYLTDTEEAIENKRKKLASVRNEAEIMGWSKELRLLEEQLLDEIDELEQDRLEEEE